jgi:hypothetical protein
MEDDDLENTCLVYELATNGSLDKFWENDLGRSRLSDEKMRIRIALEVATALRYMHEGLDGGDMDCCLSTSEITTAAGGECNLQAWGRDMNPYTKG